MLGQPVVVGVLVDFGAGFVEFASDGDWSRSARLEEEDLPCAPAGRCGTSRYISYALKLRTKYMFAFSKKKKEKEKTSRTYTIFLFF